jgi:hypothetical protein
LNQSAGSRKKTNRGYRQARLDKRQVVLGYDWPKKRKLFSARSLVLKAHAKHVLRTTQKSGMSQSSYPHLGAKVWSVIALIVWF